jgi:hypothetical protein
MLNVRLRSRRRRLSVRRCQRHSLWRLGHVLRGRLLHGAYPRLRVLSGAQWMSGRVYRSLELRGFSDALPRGVSTRQHMPLNGGRADPRRPSDHGQGAYPDPHAASVDGEAAHPRSQGDLPRWCGDSSPCPSRICASVGDASPFPEGIPRWPALRDRWPTGVCRLPAPWPSRVTHPPHSAKRRTSKAQRSGTITTRLGIISKRLGIISKPLAMIPTRTGFVPKRSGMVAMRAGIEVRRVVSVPERALTLPERAGSVPEGRTVEVWSRRLDAQAAGHRAQAPRHGG